MAENMLLSPNIWSKIQLSSLVVRIGLLYNWQALLRPYAQTFFPFLHYNSPYEIFTSGINLWSYTGIWARANLLTIFILYISFYMIASVMCVNHLITW